MQRLWEKCKRKKRLTDEQLYHSESVRRLGLCSLIAIASVLILSTTLFAILPNVFTVSGLHSPPLASVLVAGLIIRFTASQLTWISRSTPSNGLLYNFAYVINSEAMGFTLAWTQLLDGLSLLVILAQTLSDHINLLFNVNLNAQLRVEFNAANLISLRIDAIALIIIWLSALIMCCSLRVLTTISIVFLVANLFTSTSTTVVALLHNVAHLKINYIDFPYGFDEVLNGSSWLLLIILCLEMLTFSPEESEHPRKILPLIFPAISKAAIILIFVSILAFFPFGYRSVYTHESLLPATFNTIGVFSARYLMNVGSVCGLGAAVLASYLYGSRLMCSLANDKLLPSFIASTYGKGGTCRVAILLTAFFVSFLSIIPRQAIGRLLPLNICLRLCAQAFLVYESCFLPEQSELNRVPSYDHILASNRSSVINQRVLDEYSLGLSISSSDDEEEDDLIMERLWKVNGNECESSFTQIQEGENLISRPQSSGTDTCSKTESVKDSVSVPLVVTRFTDTHNCLISSCTEARKNSIQMKRWPRFHIYESEFVEPASVVLRKRSNTGELEIDEKHGRAVRFGTYFLFLSTLFSISYKIIRETTGFIPVLPVITLIISIMLSGWIFGAIYLMQKRATDVEKQRYLPCECLLSMFLLCQFLLNFPLFNYVVEAGWLIMGAIVYITFSLKRI